jgi:GcrA cell cycle regulator
LSATLIAETFGGMSRNAVLGKVHRLKLASRVESERAPVVARVVKERKVKAKRSQEEQREADRLAKDRRRRAKGILPRSEQPAPAPISAIPPLHILFIETARDHCRWICSDAGAPVTVCGHQTVNETSWCAHHAGVVFDPRRGRTHRAVLDKGRPSQSTRWAGHL